MRYYKLIKNNDTFIGVITENNFRKHQKKNNILLVCGFRSAQFVRFNDVLYRDRTWMAPIDNLKYDYEEIDIINIPKDEYDALLSSIEKNIEIIINNEEDEENIVEDVSENEVADEVDITVEYVREIKISEMRKICRKNITDGMNITLSDGNTYHFSLSTEDQINLLNINNIINNTDEKIIYHADNERCRYFSKEDMLLVINKTHNFKTYHTTYFNCLKAYINSLTDIKLINEISYGIKLPDKFTHIFLTKYTDN